MGAKVPKWQFGYKMAFLPFWHFCPYAPISKFFLTNGFFLSIIKNSMSFSCQKVYYGPSRPFHVLIQAQCLKCLHMGPNIEKNAVSTLFHFVRVTELHQPHVNAMPNYFCTLPTFIADRMSINLLN